MNILVFLGSHRASSPPNPPRLGERVARHLVAEAAGLFEVQLVDPLALPVDAVFRPVLTRPAAEVPAPMAALEARIRAADAYVMVSPEYNHSPSPALTDLLNAFPSSAFAFKPSLIATYSSGQMGWHAGRGRSAHVPLGTGLPSGLGDAALPACGSRVRRGGPARRGRGCGPLVQLCRAGAFAAGVVGTGRGGPARSG